MEKFQGQKGAKKIPQFFRFFYFLRNGEFEAKAGFFLLILIYFLVLHAMLWNKITFRLLEQNQKLKFILLGTDNFGLACFGGM